MVKCPRCGTEITKVKKEWNYRQFHVKLVDCPKCQKTFKVYYLDGKLSHTIPKAGKK